ncbi:helix-turn-helix domain-containing protein [uncultured Mycolicibacterium sp.]|uniref:helix-turn-helix domain-containing protein n=1 Tax=uncultured Mycolicibacterium sp. TaxID=2320817 RepID=UPI00262F196F|nr:helix-turn-helix domain-containing protein [uncultured Mycolicibacterium sp.]
MAMAQPWAGRDSAHRLRAVHDQFVTGRVDPSELGAAPVRPLVAESWQRCLARGVDPDRAAARPACTDLARRRAEHPLAPALPLIRRLLVQDAVDSGVVVAVTAADGTLLWVEGDPAACRRAEAMNFAPGADWSEPGAGTNAPGTALALDRETQIAGPEHYFRVAQRWSCTAAPVHDPATGALLGAIDLTGGPQVASPQALALVRATAVAVEHHLALLRLQRPGPADPAPAGPRLSVLGTTRPRWETVDAAGRRRAVPLTGRHAEILTLLVRHPQGLSADHLALLLDENDLDTVTVRAEMSRLRRVIGADHIGSRPYRLLQPVHTDFGAVLDALEAGDPAAALDRYPGPVLPQSAAPSIARLRTELRTSLRSAVLAAGDLDLLRRWLDGPDGRDDHEGWRMLYRAAPAGSALRARARGRLAGIDLDLDPDRSMQP